MKELWKDIKGYEGLYQVSNLGNVQNVRTNPPRRLKPEMTEKGYLRVMLSKKSQRKHIPIHRLVAQAFIPNPDLKPEVNHINRNKTDNYALNLEWVTSAENQRHARGIENYMLDEVYTLEDVPEDVKEEIKNLHRWSRGRFTVPKLAQKFGFKRQLIRDILHEK